MIESREKCRERVSFQCLKNKWISLTLFQIVEKRDLLLSKLSSLSYVNKHMRERQRRHPGTGTWLVRTDEFEKWMTEDCSTCLWCYGIRKEACSSLIFLALDLY